MSLAVGALSFDSIDCFEVLGVSACFGAAREGPFYDIFWSGAVRFDDVFLLLLPDDYSVTRRYAVEEDDGAAGIGAATTLEVTTIDVFFLLVVAVVPVDC